jgi:hypothetical protein
VELNKLKKEEKKEGRKKPKKLKRLTQYKDSHRMKYFHFSIDVLEAWAYWEKKAENDLLFVRAEKKVVVTV